MNLTHRPGYHFLPERNWMNDPNGLIQWQGQTHLFYQYNPAGPLHGPIHWGHAVSADLVHWEHLPIALAPSPGGPDAKGCWSGCAVDHDGVPTLIYTGIDPQAVCLATSADGLLTWDKHPANPVIAGPPAALAAQAQAQFRDPYVWREAGAWHMVIGSKDKDRGGLVLRYRSDDLVQWEYAGVLLRGDMHQTEPFPTGTMWECPSYLRLGDQRVLIYSAYSEPAGLQYPVYYAAGPHDQPFRPTAQGIVVHGPSFYAPQARRLDDGRTLMWGWLKEARGPAALLEAGWAGAMSLPMVLMWRPGGGLGIAPAEELQGLRREHWHFENVDLGPGAAGLLGDIKGDSLEIEAVFEPRGNAEFGLQLRASLDGAEQTLITYQAAARRLVVDTRASSLNTEVERGAYAVPVSLEAHRQLRLHVFLDRSVLEVFANDGACLASRLYPTRVDSLGLDVFGAAGSARLVTMDVWNVATIW